MLRINDGRVLTKTTKAKTTKANFSAKKTNGRLKETRTYVSGGTFYCCRYPRPQLPRRIGVENPTSCRLTTKAVCKSNTIHCTPDH